MDGLASVRGWALHWPGTPSFSLQEKKKKQRKEKGNGGRRRGIIDSDDCEPRVEVAIVGGGLVEDGESI